MWQSSCLYQPHPLLQSMINDRVKMMCFLFCVISLVVKQLQTSSEKQWSIVASHFSMLVCHTRRHTINHTQQKLNVHNKIAIPKIEGAETLGLFVKPCFELSRAYQLEPA